MQQSLQERIRELNSKHRKSRTWKKLVNGMACVVVFVTTYALILPAITMETTCGVEEHIHTMECYEEGWIFPEEALICELPEIIEHVHTEECYKEVIYTVSDGSSVGALSERTVSGSDATGAISNAEGTGEGSSTIFVAEDGTAWELICEIPEETVHEHTINCYETSVLEHGYGRICGLEEHEHTLACWSDETADVENEYNWESTFADVELTGVWNKDVITIAETQLGYAESTKNYEVEEDGETLRGYTRYGQWYGDAYEDWGAMFVSFCLYYAQTAMPLDNEAQGWIEVLASESYDLYREAGEYTPIPGDIVFFAEEEVRGDDHVGFVYQMTDATETEPATITVIEGNTAEGKVELVTYTQGDALILGYGELQAAQMLMANAFGIMTLDEPMVTDAASGYTATATGNDYSITVHYDYANADSVPSNQIVSAAVTENTAIESAPYTTYKTTIESALESNRALGEVLRVFDIELIESATDTYTFDMLERTNGSKSEKDWGYNYEITSVSDAGALNIDFTYNYGEIRYYLPEDIKPSTIQNVKFNYNDSLGEGIIGKLAYKLYVVNNDGTLTEVASGYGKNNQVSKTFGESDSVIMAIMFNQNGEGDTLDDVVIDSITITTDPLLTAVSPVAPLENADVDITLNGVTGAEWNVMAFSDTSGAYNVISPVTTTVADGNTTVSFATDSLEGYEAYAVYNTVKTSSAVDGLHISFGASNAEFATLNLNTNIKIRSESVSDLSINSGNYAAVTDVAPVYGALTGNINVAAGSYPYVRFLLSNIGISYTIDSQDMLYVRLNANDNLKDLQVAIEYPYANDNGKAETIFTNPTVSEIAPDGYKIYGFDISSLAGQTPNFICIRWPNAPDGTETNFAIDYLSIRSEELNTDHFQTHFSSVEYSPLMTLDAWGGVNADGEAEGKGTRFTISNGVLIGSFVGEQSSYYNVVTAKDEGHSLNYVIQEGDVLQFRINTNGAVTPNHFNGYKIVIGGKDFPLTGSDTGEQEGIGGGRGQLNAPNHKLETGFISQGSYEIVSVYLSEYVGKTIDWVEFRWNVDPKSADVDKANWETDAPKGFMIDHIRIGQLALTAYDHSKKDFNTSATPLTNLTNVDTVGKETIDFKLFDYSQPLTDRVDNGNGGYTYTYQGINDNGLLNYFEFQGRSFNDNPGNMRNRNSAVDADGYIDTYYNLDKDGTADSSDLLKAYNFNTKLNITSEGYLFRRTKVLPVLSGENRDGFPQLDGTAHQLLVNGAAPLIENDVPVYKDGDTVTIETKNLESHGKSLGYLFDTEHPGTGVTAYDPSNTILQYDDKEGLYWYDSAKNAVDYDKSQNEFYVRNYIERSDTSAENVENNLKGDTSGKTYGDFLPFTYWGGETQYYVDDNPNKATFFYDGDYEQNYWFGMTMETHFYQPPAGINPKSDKEMVFNFSGDDDIWVFVDGVLVLDLGGTHGIVSGSINFATGEVTQHLDWTNDMNDNRSYSTTLYECFEAAGVEPKGGWQDVASVQTYGLMPLADGDSGTAKTFADFSDHTFTFYYLERGTSVSNCSMEFNLLTISEESLLIGKSLTDKDGNEWSSIYDSELEYQFRLFKSDENGNRVADDSKFGYELFAPPGTEYTVIETNEIRMVDNDGYFFLKANEHALFEFANMEQELGSNQNYVIVEFLPADIAGQYAGIKDSITNTTVEVTEQGGEYIGGANSANTYVRIEYENVVDTTKLSTLSIEKAVKIDGDTSDFVFEVTLDGNPLLETATYDIYDTTGDSPVLLQEKVPVTVTKDGEGNVIRSTVQVKANQKAVLNGILAGTEYMIKETEDLTQRYSVEYTVTSSQNGECGVYSSNGLTYIEGVTEINDEVAIVITNWEKGTKETITMDKVLTNPDGTAAEYSFLLEEVEVTTDDNGNITGSTVVPDGTSMKATVSYTGKEDPNTLKTETFLLDYPAEKLPDAQNIFYYRITEIPINDGVTVYDETEYIVKVVVDKPATGTYTTTMAYYRDGVLMSNDETISFVNSLGGAVLPNTGGRGPTTYYAIGGLLMTASLIYLGLIRRRKKEGG